MQDPQTETGNKRGRNDEEQISSGDNTSSSNCESRSKEPRVDLPCVHKHDAMAQSTVSLAFAYLDSLAFKAEQNTKVITSEIEQLTELEGYVTKKIKDKIAELKEQAQRNLTNSLEKLITLNGTQFSEKQTLLYPRGWILEELDRTLENTLRTRILDLPHHILVHIVEYLPPKSVLAARLVCLDFWTAVCEATRTECTLETLVERYGEVWQLMDCCTVSTPTADFWFQVTVQSTGFTVKYWAEEMKLYAQAKHFAIEITDSRHKKTLAQQEFVAPASEQAETGHGTVDMIPLSLESWCSKVPSKFHLRIDVTDHFAENSRLRPLD
ncbi:hypothetical protein Pelo_17506 [Pelomyxa schiedti]|nr:hypothetical protein Pelo_17506 [Pelomyxa schiedti]